MISWGLFSEKALDVLQNADARVNILHGSVRSSKTVTCTVKWIEYLINGPKGDMFMVGKTRATLQRNVLNDLFDIIGEQNWKWTNKQEGELFILGRRVYCIGANDEKAEGKIRGATIAGAYCDEVSLYPESFFNQLMARMSVPGARCYCNTNPDNPKHWFNVNYIKNNNLVNKKVWHFTMDDNANLTEEYKTSLAQMYTGVWFKRMILGLWVVAEGLIYDMVKDDYDHHLAKDIVRPYERYYVTIDYGTQNPCTFVLMGLYNNVWYCVKEYYYSGRDLQAQKTDLEYVEDLIDFVGDLKISGYVVDPSAASFIAQMKKKGISNIIKADNDVLDGLRDVATMFMKKSLMICENCKNIWDEVYAYLWDKKASERGEDKPLKENDHAMDAIRYFVKTIVMRRSISTLKKLKTGL